MTKASIKKGEALLETFQSGSVAQYLALLQHPDVADYLATTAGRESTTHYLVQHVDELREHLLDQEVLIVHGDSDVSGANIKPSLPQSFEVIEQSVDDGSVDIIHDNSVSHLLDSLSGVEIFKDNPELQAAVMKSPLFVDELLSLKDESLATTFDNNDHAYVDNLSLSSQDPELFIIEEGIDHGTVVLENFNPQQDLIRIIGSDSQSHDIQFKDLVDEEGDLVSTEEFRSSHEEDELLSQLVIEGDEEEVHIHPDHGDDELAGDEDWEVVVDVSPPEDPIA